MRTRHADHAWYDWLAWDRLGDPSTADVRKTYPTQAAGTNRDRSAPLLNPARLPEVAACRERLRIEPGQHALLLRSAAGAGAAPRRGFKPWRPIRPREAWLPTCSRVASRPAASDPSGSLPRVLGVTKSVEGREHPGASRDRRAKRRRPSSGRPGAGKSGIGCSSAGVLAAGRWATTSVGKLADGSGTRLDAGCRLPAARTAVAVAARRGERRRAPRAVSRRLAVGSPQRCSVRRSV